MNGPRANFTCLGKKCKTEDGAPVYELPVAATRCPVCSSKRIQRLWSGPENAPQIARTDHGQKPFLTGAGKANERMIADSLDAQRKPRVPSPNIAVPVKQIGAVLQNLGAAQPLSIPLPSAQAAARPSGSYHLPLPKL